MDRELPSLPRGRHRLSRDDVRAAQRHRLLFAMAETVAERGYARTSVADVLGRARISRETFYQQFADKQECFLAALDLCAETVAGLVIAAVGGEHGDTEPPLVRFERGLSVYLAALVEEWTITRCFFLECYAAGPAAQRRRFAAQEQFARLLAAHFADDPAWRRAPDPDFAARALAGALSSLVAGAVAADRPQDLAGLHRPVVDLLTRLLSG